ncbi:MAG: hypothetical protein KAU38_07770 [Desulfobacterales bacterium]|nr:hypothetical protein [Desulfobacterales bacterium]
MGKESSHRSTISKKRKGRAKGYFPMMSVEEAAKYLDLSPRTLYNRIAPILTVIPRWLVSVRNRAGVVAREHRFGVLLMGRK